MRGIHKHSVKSKRVTQRIEHQFVAEGYTVGPAYKGGKQVVAGFGKYLLLRLVKVLLQGLVSRIALAKHIQKPTRPGPLVGDGGLQHGPGISFFAVLKFHIDAHVFGDKYARSENDFSGVVIDDIIAVLPAFQFSAVDKHGLCTRQHNDKFLTICAGQPVRALVAFNTLKTVARKSPLRN